MTMQKRNYTLLLLFLGNNLIGHGISKLQGFHGIDRKALIIRGWRLG